MLYNGATARTRRKARVLDLLLNQFEDVIDRPDSEIDLARAALLLAMSEYPDISIERELFMLQRLAGDISSRLLEEDDPLFCMNTLSQHLFDDLGFRDDSEDYYDPRNSYLNKVLERKQSIPITLALVYVEVGKRLSIPLVGVGLPGHFLVRHRRIPAAINIVGHIRRGSWPDGLGEI